MRYKVLLLGVALAFPLLSAVGASAGDPEPGAITTVAGLGAYCGDGGAATSGCLWLPHGIALDSSGDLYVADTFNHRVRKVNTSGVITTVAGNGTETGTIDGEGGDPSDDLGDGGPATSATLYGPIGVTLDPLGNLYVADFYNSRIRKVDTSGVITTVAGSGPVGMGSGGFSGDEGPATSAKLNSPTGVALDSAGNLYIADYQNSRIRRVVPGADGVINGGPDEIITTVAGNGTRTGSIDGEGGDPADDLGDGGPGTTATLSFPWDLALDSSGNLFIADTWNSRVRRVIPGGDGVIDGGLDELITTVAGNGTPTGSIDGEGGDPSDDLGDGGPATSATMQYPYGIVLTSSGDLYIGDGSNARVRKVDGSGTITTVAGNGTWGYCGDGGPATSACFVHAWGVAVDGSGNLYFADRGNHRIRKVDGLGTISTFAGVGGYCGDGGPATSACLNGPTALAADGSGNLYIADRGNGRIRKMDTSGIISTVAGNGRWGYSGDDGLATEASLDPTIGVAVDSSGNVYIASKDHRIRKVDASGIITTLAGNGTRTGSIDGEGGDPSDDLGDGGPAASATLSFWVGDPVGLALDSSGNLYIADQNNHRIRKVDTSGIITTVAGNGTRTGAIDGEGGDPSDDLGDGGPATAASLSYPTGLTLSSSGDLYIADSWNARVRKVDGSGTITTVAGSGCRLGDGGPATRASLGPSGLALDSSGNLHIADLYSNRIRKVDTSGIITTVAGNGTPGYSGDGGPATDASLYWPSDVALGASGSLYIADHQNNRIRMVQAPLDPDPDGDGSPNSLELALESDPNNPDSDGDHVSDGPLDPDGAGPIVAGPDNCATVHNPGQEDTMDSDGLGDVCDPCPNDAENDGECDDICGDVDNCPTFYNPDQTDTDGDGLGDACDPDDDNDGCADGEETGPEPGLGGTRDPLDPYDFYDVPVPTAFNGGTLDDRDQAVSILNDVLAVLEYSGTSDGGPPNGLGRQYNQDNNGDTLDDGLLYDRSVGPVWSDAPDGAVNILADVLLVLAQSGHSCQADP
ncbi:MAG: flexitail domain-containing putative surface protein [Dehalococcoidia bacterium]